MVPSQQDSTWEPHLCSCPSSIVGHEPVRRGKDPSERVSATLFDSRCSVLVVSGLVRLPANSARPRMLRFSRAGL